MDNKVLIQIGKRTLLSFLVVNFSLGVTLGEELLRTAVLPGEHSNDQILAGEYWWPDSPAVDTSTVEDPHFVADAFGKVPAPGVHPRILLSPEDLPGLREKIKISKSAAYWYHQLTFNQEKSIRTEGTFSHGLLKALASGDLKKSGDILTGKEELPMAQKYSHRYGFAYVLMSEAFDALIREDEVKGKEVASAIATLSKIYKARLEAMDHGYKTGELKGVYETSDLFHGFKLEDKKVQFNGDVWRSGRRAAINGEPWFAFMYDYAHKYMNEEERQACRETLNLYHFGRTTMGSHMPHHFRNWNWIAIGSGGLYLTALATEGEEGNDPRVIRHAREILTDFVKYGWSDKGSSNEAIGYTQFGLLWGVPGMVAMARRGHQLWNWKRWRGSVDWYAYSSQPNAMDQPIGKSLRFISHGDGGQGGPSAFTVGAFKKFYPKDPVVDYVLQRCYDIPEKDENGAYPVPKRDFYNSYPHMELLFCADTSETEYNDGASLGLDLTFFDEERNSMITRSTWGPQQLQFQMEARNDSTSPNHHHADRGAFTLAGAGRVWADERFRSVESRHHSMVIIDGKGQGYFTPPGDWLGLVDNKDITLGRIDASYAYAWAWPSHLCGFPNPEDPRRSFARWQHFTEKADQHLKDHPDYDWKASIDPHPTLDKFYNGYEKGDPRIWDEHARPQRIPHNPVEKAFRSSALVRGKYPYVILVDDIKKDDQVRLYEWQMMLPKDVTIEKIDIHEVILAEEWPAEKDMKKGYRRPMCSIHILDRHLPKDQFTTPETRFESIQLKDARSYPNPGPKTLQKRLVIPSRAVEPKFKMLLYPHLKGERQPKITWNDARTQVVVDFKDQKDVIHFYLDNQGKTLMKVERDGKTLGGL